MATRTTAAPAFTVFSAYSGKVYACCVTLEVGAGWTKHYGGHAEELAALDVGETWRSHPDSRGIAVMRAE
jgi:hypothetical protein